MTRKSYWINEDGLRVGFGGQVEDNNDAGSVNTKGLIKEVKMLVEAGNLQSVGEAITKHNADIEGNVYIVSADLNVFETFDAAIEVGTMQADGTAIDQDGLIATATPVADTRVEGSGAQINTAIGETAYLAVTPTTGAPTTGRAQLIVRYEVSAYAE